MKNNRYIAGRSDEIISSHDLNCNTIAFYVQQKIRKFVRILQLIHKFHQNPEYNRCLPMITAEYKH